MTPHWAVLPLKEQNKIDAKLLKRVLEKDGMTSSEAARVNWRKL